MFEFKIFTLLDLKDKENKKNLINLNEPVFTHDHDYVALSRVPDKNNLKSA